MSGNKVEYINRPNLQCMDSADWNIWSYEIVKRLVNNAWIENGASGWWSFCASLIMSYCCGEFKVSSEKNAYMA